MSERIARTVGLELPRARETELVLMVVDPFHVHAYWHIDRADLFQVRLCAGEACGSLRLRLHHADPGALGEWRGVDHAVEGLSNRCYIEVPVSGSECFAEIGIAPRVGGFVRLARSNRLHLPTHRESPRYELLPVDTRAEVPSGLEECAKVDVGIAKGMEGPLPAPMRSANWTHREWSGGASEDRVSR